MNKNKFDNEVLNEMDEIMNEFPELNFIDIINKSVRIISRDKITDASQISSKKLVNGLKEYKKQLRSDINGN